MITDKRKNNGGNKNAGRKPKADEQKLIEKLSPFEPIALSKLEESVKNGSPWAIKLYFEYMYGKPKQQTDITSGGKEINIPIINFLEP